MAHHVPEAVIPAAGISVVIQGPLFSDSAEGLGRCVASIHAHLPGAEVVVSTWDTEDLQRVPAGCVLVVSEDPGPIIQSDGVRNNVNRQIVSTVAGIRAASRPWVLKMRADHALASPAMCAVPAPARLLDRRIRVTELYTRAPERIPMAFFLSDLVQFGSREDLLRFWDGDQVHPTMLAKSDVPWFVPRIGGAMTPEQALVLRWLEKTGTRLRLRWPHQINRYILNTWSRVLAENFDVVSRSSAGIVYPARFRADDPALAWALGLLEPDRFRALPSKPFRIWRARLNLVIPVGATNLRLRYWILHHESRARYIVPKLVGRALRFALARLFAVDLRLRMAIRRAHGHGPAAP